MIERNDKGQFLKQLPRYCSVEGCDRKHDAKGLCKTHYVRMKKHGAPERQNIPLQGRPLIERFKEKYIPVTETGCWLWTGSIDRYGYGRMSVDYKETSAPRLSWKLHKGEIPKGLHVLHKCDTPACVNPDHLFVGTHKENMHDAVKKGRPRRPYTSFKRKDIIKIRRLRKQGYTLARLVKMFNACHTTIRNIYNNKRWKHV